MTLFDELQRSDLGPAMYTEPDFSYLNRSARPEAGQARASLDQWFADYLALQGEAASRELRIRFRSNDNLEHNSALTELYLHNFFSVHGLTAKVHPEIPGKESRPDFLVLKADSPFFYLEAVVVGENEGRERGNKLKDTIYDAVDAVRSPDFLISTQILAEDPMSSPSPRQITDKIQQQVDSLDYDQVCKDIEAGRSFPQVEIEAQGWAIQVSITPVKNEARTKRRIEKTRNLGVRSDLGFYVDTDKRIMNSVKGKVKKYGRLPLPFIVAANVRSGGLFCDDEEVMSALCGELSMAFPIPAKVNDAPQIFRKGGGIFVDPAGTPRNTRLSCLWVMGGLGAWRLNDVKQKLWVHPFATNPLPERSLNLPHKVLDKATGRMVDVDVQ